MRKQKPKSSTVDMSCPCGKTWLAIFVSGVVRSFSRCPACAKKVSTKTFKILGSKTCQGCGRDHKKTPCEFCGGK